MTCSSAAFITSTLSTSLRPNVPTPIVFDTVVADNGGFWDPDHPTRLTVPPGKAGLYLAHGNVEFTANPNGERLVLIRRNGRTISTPTESVDLGHSETYVPGPYPTDTPQVHANTPAVLDEGDYVELFGLAVFLPGDMATVPTRHVPPNTPKLALFYQGPAFA